MMIPKYWYRDHGYKLPISFRVQTEQSIFKESYGVDNFRLHALCRDRELRSPVLEPDEFGEDGSFYCSAKDFPCEGGNVNICHYSAKQGYQTYCIPEADSEVLRFYKSNYCGPCVGGFGGVNQQKL